MSGVAWFGRRFFAGIHRGAVSCAVFEAEAPAAALPAGLGSGEVRAPAQRELPAPDSVTNEIVARKMAREEQGGSAMA